VANIDISEAVSLLVGCSDVLLRERDLVRGEWTPEEPPAVVLLAALVTRLVHALSAVPDEKLAEIAAIVERVFADGSDDAKSATATGFLEAVLSATGNTKAATAFLTKLGPRALKHCRDWDEFCGVKTPGLWRS
jgi:hypothetical protein